MPIDGGVRFSATSLRSTYWTFMVTAGLTIGLGSLFSLGRTSGRSSGRDPLTANFKAAGFAFNAMFLSQLAIGVLGVLIIAAEYSSGMNRTSFTAVPQRGFLLAVKATAFATFFASQPILNRGTLNLGVSITSPHALRIVIGAALYLTVCSLLGVPLGALLRSTAAAVTALAGLLFILPILMNFLPVSWHRDAIAQWLPSNAGIQIIEQTTQPLQLSPWVGLAVVAGWVVLAFAAALVLLRRRDA